MLRTRRRSTPALVIRPVPPPPPPPEPAEEPVLTDADMLLAGLAAALTKTTRWQGDAT